MTDPLPTDQAEQDADRFVWRPDDIEVDPEEEQGD